MKVNTKNSSQASGVAPQRESQGQGLLDKQGFPALDCDGVEEGDGNKEKEEPTNPQPTKPYGVQNHVYDDRNAAFYYDVLTKTSPAPLLYCPQNLDLRTEMLRHGRQHLVNHLWKLYYVITLLYLHRWNKSSETEDYRPLMAIRLRQALGSHTNQILALLKSLGVIETNNHYVVGQHSKGYRLCEPYRSTQFRQIKPCELPRLPRAVARWCNHRIETDGSPQNQHLLNTLKRVTLDESAYEFTEQHTFASPGEFDYYMRSAEFVRLGQWFFTYDKRTGRVFNNVTSLPKELRPYLRLDGKSLVELDVVNCQPFLLLDLYSDEPERERFAEIVCGGKFYESLDNKLAVPFGESGRQELKKAVFSQILFDKIRPTSTKLYLAFRQLFPSLDVKIIEMKAGNHNRLALHLQKLEAELIIGGVVRQIALVAKFPVLTIHDSILTLPEHQAEVRELLETVFFERFGCVPELREKELACSLH